MAKKRTSAENVTAIDLVGDVDGKEVILVDDMTETAGTLTAAAEILKKNGAKKVYAAVTHGTLNEIGYQRLRNGPIDQLITTDSVPVNTQDLPITVVSIASLLAQGILRIHNHESVSSLFSIKGY